MKKIKRSISILLIAMMALAMLGGCGNNSTSGNSTANGDSAKATEKTSLVFPRRRCNHAFL